MWLLLVALVGFVVPNGLFISWLLHDYQGLGAVLQNKLALAFILDAALTLAILTTYFARHPIGAVRWYWFLILSLLGGLCFGLPVFYLLNTRRVTAPLAH